MKIFYVPLILTALLFFNSCLSISNKSFVRSPDYDPDKTVKIVAINTNDVILGRLEHHLLEKGITVVSDNYLRGAVPTGMGITMQSSDTTYTIPQFHPVTLELFQEKPTDYILRYEYDSGLSTNKRSFSYFNARLINTQTGVFDASFTFTQGSLGWNKLDVDMVLSMFARALAGD
ncbi:MAG: hypothetical protein H6559_17965 [Lewinellaceae bacterium]|nr:hypothetical protein [Sinomicrobium sp.]MCB9294990.1 hypothetical protein [Lewinellaceae bacterium]